jgi:putative ABC transport system ATP-binding protein
MVSVAQPDSPAVTDIAARTDRALKIFGSGDTAVTALDNISVSIEAVRFTAIMGPSGSGKSTLLHCLAGLEPLTGGSIYIGDTDLVSLSDSELTVLRRDRIGFVFQTFNLVPTMTAERNITLQLRLGRHRIDKPWFDTVVDELGLRDRLHHRPSELSGGQQQRVAVARALINRPDIIFADEPTGNLDTSSGQEVLGFLRRAVDDFGQTVVMVTHDPGAAAHADRVVFLVDGRIVGVVTEPTVDLILDQLRQLEG